MSKEADKGTRVSAPGRRAILKGLAGATSTAFLSSRVRLSRAAGVGTGGSGPTAVVIGAGIAGLSAAYELTKAGFRVSIFEKENFTGGRMRDAWMGPLYGFVHAAGVFKANREQFALAAELGIADELDGEHGLTPIDNGIGTYGFDARFHVDEVMRVPGMSAETQRRLPSLQADLDRIREEVDPCLLATGAAYDDESLADYYERMLGKESASEVLRYWVEPALEWWGWPAAMTSKIAMLSWYAQQKEDFVIPSGGIGVLTRKLNEILNVQHQVAVQYITPANSEGRHTIHYLTPELERRTVTPDIVVCATEGKYLRRLVQELTPQQDQMFKQIFTTKEAIVFYILDEKSAPAKPLSGYYTPSHPDPFKRRVNSWNVDPAEPENHHRPATVRIDLSRPEVPKWQVSGKTMPEYCEPLVKHFYPAFDMKNVVDIVNYTCDDLIYIPVGYCKQMAEVLRQQAKERRGIYFAGEYVAGAHTGAACASGRSVGRLIAKHWRA
jgi:oxygen-dependent protoporphyrinogen oxidase